MTPLGEIQLAVLAALKRHDGYWYEGCGWLWDTPSHTRGIFESLRKRGEVVATDEPVHGGKWKRRVYRERVSS